MLERLIMAIAFCLSVNSSLLAEEVVLKFHSFSPMSANSNLKFVKPWGEKLTKESKGEIKLEIYPSMQLGGKPPQLVDQVRDGAVDIVWTLAGYTPGRFPKLEVFDLPFMASSAFATSQAAQEYAETIGYSDLQDYKVLAVHVHAPGKIHTKNRLVKSVSDFEGLKLRGPTRVITNLLKEFGATPIGMPVPQVAPSLSKGVIDGMVVPYEIMPSFKLQELSKLHSEVSGDRGLYTTCFLFLMNKKKYEALNDFHKKIIDDNSGLKLAKLAGKLWDEFEVSGRVIADQSGGTFYSISDKELEKMKNIGHRFTRDWISVSNSRGLDGEKLVSVARSLVKLEQ